MSGLFNWWLVLVSGLWVLATLKARARYLVSTTNFVLVIVPALLQGQLL